MVFNSEHLNILQSYSLVLEYTTKNRNLLNCIHMEWINWLTFFPRPIFLSICNKYFEIRTERSVDVMGNIESIKKEI